jgi:hypothetical protein
MYDVSLSAKLQTNSNGVLALLINLRTCRIVVSFLSVATQQGGLAFLLLLFLGDLVVQFNVEVSELPAHLRLLEELILLFLVHGVHTARNLAFFFGIRADRNLAFFFGIRVGLLGSVVGRCDLLPPKTFEGFDDSLDVVTDFVALTSRALEHRMECQISLVVLFFFQVTDDFGPQH